MDEHILINMKFTDKSHDTLESITINLKDYFAEYGYVPRTEAIPIEWINELANNLKEEDFEKAMLLLDMVDLWEEENEQL